jgi:uncharacterized protein
MADVPSKAVLIRRTVARQVDAALQDTRVVLIVGPRQAGKTTLARTYETPSRPYLTLDDPQALTAAKADPVGFIRGLPAAIIDEIQRAPELMLAIKEAVDRDTTPGRYLLTGSANIMALPTVADSLAGRAAVISLLPFAQSELEGGQGTFIERIFAGDLPVAGKPVIGSDLMARALRGGYPEVLTRQDESRRQAWHEDYLTMILDRDVRDIANIEQLDKLPKLLRMLGEHSGELLNHLSLASPLGLSALTVQKYITVLERLYLVRILRPWHSNRLSRLTKTPKLHFLDSGLLATVRGDTTASLKKDKARFGAILETFAFAEILKLASWSAGKVTVSQFRTKEKEEVDLVLEDSRGRIVGIEIKASATSRPQDFNGLRKLQEATNDKFVRGLVLHDHDRVTPISEKLHAAPISILWTM